MKKFIKTWGRQLLSVLMVVCMVVALVPFTAKAADSTYAVTVTPSTTDVKAGDEVTLSIEASLDGEVISDLSEAGLNLTTWLDYYSANNHGDGNSDAVIASANDLTTTVTLPSAGTYYLVTELYDSDWSKLAGATTTFTVTEATVEASEIALTNGDFETGDSTGWVLTGYSSVATDSWASNNTTNTLSLWLSDDEATDGAASYTVNLTAGTYSFGFDLSGAASDSGLSYKVTAGDDVLVAGSETYTTAGWDVWSTYTTDEFTLTEDTEVTFTLSGTEPVSYWGNLDNLTLTGTGAVIADDDDDDDDSSDDAVEAEINVEKVADLSDDFIMGMDISSVISEFNSGVTYKDYDGNTIDNITDFCKFIASCGVTSVRVRVWNDPYDSDGNGYGGGNNDIDTAVEIAKGCAAAGLDMLVDFHCSDFWCDPGKQQAPKAWSEFTVDEKAEALKTYLSDSLTKLAATGANISMVQVGNETTSGGFIGETDVANVCTLFSAGSAAIRAFDENIKVVIHVTNPEKSRMTEWAKKLNTYNVDYDVLATSYYPSWHGTFANLKSQLQAVQNTYGKEVMVAETSYAYTLDDTDGHDNTIRDGNNTTMACETQYAFSVQGQANYLRDLINLVNEAGGLGVYYWEPAWITVGDTTGLSDDEYTEQVEANKLLWEKYGSGWASSYASDYDPDDAGVWYGGSAVDNQALFAADGSALASMNIWNLVRTGAVSVNVTVDEIETAEESITVGGSYTLPETITVTYNSGEVAEAVTWNEEDIAKIDVNTAGVYTVKGTVALSQEVNDGDYAGETTVETTYTLTVKEPNIIGDDWSFENGKTNFDGLSSVGKGIDKETPYDGSYCLHWYKSAATAAAVNYLGDSSEGITLEPGKYTFECVAQGMSGEVVTLNILEHGSDTVIASGEGTTLTGWATWLTPTVSFTITEATTVDLQMAIDIQATGWGTIDCMYLYKTGDVEADDDDDDKKEDGDAEDGDDGDDADADDGDDEKTNLTTGVHVIDGVKYYIDGTTGEAAAYTGLAKYNGKFYYFLNGKESKVTGLVKNVSGNGKWYYVKDGVFTSYAGLSKIAGKSNSALYYVRGGVFQPTYTGLIKNTSGNGKWYYVVKGVYKSYTGITKIAGLSSSKWYAVRAGVYQPTYTGLIKNGSNGKWYYVKNGIFQSGYTGIITWSGAKWKVVKGVKQ
jgi:arabinogalactan endo-1,4-beta-galactosidase